MPELYQKCLESWKKYAPDYEIKIWNLDTYRPDKCLFFEQAIEHKNWAFASDYARAGHPIIEEICESYEKRPYLKSDGTWDNSTCPVRYTQVIEKHGLKKNGGFQFVEDITVYPFEVLTGKSFDTGIIYSTELSYTVHHHNGSWIPGPARRAVFERYEKIRKWMGETGRT